MTSQTFTGKIGPREHQILRILWLSGPASVRELHDHHFKELAYSTVLTICVRMSEKGLLERQRAAASDPSRSANAYVYTPRYSEAELAQSQVAPLSSLDAGTDREAVEQLLAYVGALRDETGARTSDAALDLIAALLERAEVAERQLHALKENVSPRAPARGDPPHEHRGRVCRVCGRQAPPQPASRHDDLRVCRDDGCRKEARRRDNLAKQLRHQQKKQAPLRDLVTPAG